MSPSNALRRSLLGLSPGQLAPKLYDCKVQPLRHPALPPPGDAGTAIAKAVSIGAERERFRRAIVNEIQPGFGGTPFCGLSQIWRALYYALVSLLVFGEPLNTTAKNPQPSRSLGAMPAPVETPVLFTGLPAVVELPQGSLKSLFAKVNAGTKCDAFTLVPYGVTLQAVRVTTSGLGAVDFSVSNKNVANQVTVSELRPEGIRVNFCVHGDLVRRPGSSVQGKLIVFAAGYKPTTANVKIERPSLAPWVTALQWFFAILVPAILAGIFGVGSAWATSSVAQRREQKTAFRRLKDDKWDDMADFFHTHLPNILQECANEQDFAKRLRSELQSRGYWTSIPWKERDRIERFIKLHDASRMRSVLAVLFWEWKKELSELHK